MKKTKLQQEQEMLQEEARKQLILVKAKYENDISILLRPWFSFRIFVKFKKAFYDKKGHKKDSQHFYGMEHSCSYRQCLYGHVKEIQLSKLQGYDQCIKMAEEKFRGKYHLARIYTRTSLPGGSFDVLCREYDDKSQIKEQQDPLILKTDDRVLYFSAHNGMLSVSEIDFKSELEENLK